MKSVTVIPNADRILVRPWDDTDRASQLHLPDKMDDVEVLTGQVMAIGPGSIQAGAFIPTTSKVGDTVLFDSRTGRKWRHDQKNYLWMHDSQVIAHLRPAETPASIMRRDDPDEFPEHDDAVEQWKKNVSEMRDAEPDDSGEQKEVVPA